MIPEAPLNSASRPIGWGILILALLAFGFVLGRLRQREGRESDEEKRWWYGYLLDLAFVGEIALASLALLVMGMAAPLALLGGFLATFTLYVLDYACGRWFPRRIAHFIATAATALALLPLLANEEGERRLRAFIEWLF